MAQSIAERHKIILNRLKINGYVNVSELSGELKVSTVTIRKDLKLLEDRKLLFRTHGSATPQNPYIADRHVNEKEKIQVEEKQRIALYAATLIEPFDNIILASGTTINEFSRHINPAEGLTILCSSLGASQNLTIHKEIEVIQIGGMVRKSSSSVAGPHAERMIKGFTCNKLFLGVDGIDPDFGLTTTNALEASLNQVMIDAAQKTIILADSTKFGRRGFGWICGLDKADLIITDNGAPYNIVQKIRDRGVEVILV